MKSREEIIKYRQDIRRRFKELEDAIDNDTISTSKAVRLRKNYNIQLHLIRYILNEDKLSDLLKEKVGEDNE